jgi:hypothetical protein
MRGILGLFDVSRNIKRHTRTADIDLAQGSLGLFEKLERLPHKMGESYLLHSNI